MAKTATRKKSINSVHPGVTMVQKWITELKQKTGRSLEEWLKLIRKEGPPDEAVRGQMFVGAGTSQWIDSSFRSATFSNQESTFCS
jgi:hypothetical protein